MAKIKSKLYHKLKKKERERDEEKLRQYMQEVDPEAAKAYQEKIELKAVEERLRARHGTGTKYAKNLKRFRGMDDKETRDAYHQAVLDRQALTQKRQRIEQSSSESDESDGDSEMSEGELREKAAKQMEEELASDSGDANDQDMESESENEGVIKMDFSKQDKNKPKKAQDKGIQAMKFMKKSEDKQKSQLKADAEAAIGQIRNNQFVSTADKFG